MTKFKKSVCRKIGKSIYSIGKIVPSGEFILLKIPKKQSKKICKRVVK